MNEPQAPPNPILVRPDESRLMRLTRNPNRAYLSAVTGLQGKDLNRLMSLNFLHFRKGEGPETANAERYYEAAKRGILWAVDHFKEAVKADEDFARFLHQYAEMSQYLNLKNQVVNPVGFRVRDKKRDVIIPDYLISGFSNVLKSQGAEAIRIPKGASAGKNEEGYFYDSFFNESTAPLTQIITRLRQEAGNAIYMGKFTDKNPAVSWAIRFLRSCETGWLWEFGNHSRSMNLFHALVFNLNLKGEDVSIPHGVIDLAASVMDEKQFESYVRYCRSVPVIVDKPAVSIQKKLLF
jgi:hypothetical protein